MNLSWNFIEGTEKTYRSWYVGVLLWTKQGIMLASTLRYLVIFHSYIFEFLSWVTFLICCSK